MTYGEIHHLVDEYIVAPRLGILEVGCGYGWLSLELAREGHDINAIDSNRKSIQIAKGTMETDPYKAERGNLEYQIAEFPDWKHPKEDYDIVIFCNVLHHIPKPERALSRVAELLRPGGEIICVEYAYDRIDERTAKWIYDMRTSLQRSGWYGPRKKLSKSPEKAVQQIVEEHQHPARKDHLNRFMEMQQPLEKYFERTYLSWEPYIYWDLIGEMRVPSEEVEMATAQSIMSMEAALIQRDSLNSILFCFVGSRR